MAKPLSERRKADRKTMAARVIALCAEMGATVDRADRDREIRLEISIGEARVGIEFDGGSFNTQPDTFCMPWNTALGSSARMTDAFGRAVGAEVNPHHRAKCTGFAAGFESLVDRLRLAMICINSGWAFERTQPRHDFECADHGSIASITPLTDAAVDWLSDNVEPAALGVPVLAEPRVSLDIALGMIGDGLTCENSELVEA